MMKMTSMKMKKPSYSAVKENLELFWLSLTLRISNFFQFLKDASRYYSNVLFCKTDLSLKMMYLLNSPYSISKQFLQKKGESDIYAYGETPLTTLEMIAKNCGITSNDVVFELGCGRGRACFWLNSFTLCRVVGIDFVPDFIQNANLIKNRFQLKNVEFRHENILDTNLANATVIYLYGTNLEDETITKLIKKFEKLPAGTKIITVSYPLSDYTSSRLFEIMKCFPAQFTWGEADVYLQVKK